MVLSVDEKSQVQALGRSQPAFGDDAWDAREAHPRLRPQNPPPEMFAAFNTADGTVISSMHRRHRSIEFKKFLTKIDAEVPADLDVHLSRHPFLDQRLEHSPQALPLDQDHRRDPRIPRTPTETNLRRGTLEGRSRPFSSVVARTGTTLPTSQPSRRRRSGRADVAHAAYCAASRARSLPRTVCNSDSRSAIGTTTACPSPWGRGQIVTVGRSSSDTHAEAG